MTVTKRFTTTARVLIAACVGLLLASCAAGPDPELPAPYRQTQAGLTLAVPGDFSTIQAAMDAAQAGDTVLVGAGTFYENVTMRSNVTLAGQGGTATALVGQVKLGAASGCTVRDLFINRLGASGLGLDVGIVGTPGGHTLSGNLIQSFETGIRLDGQGTTTITGNIITNSKHTGIRLHGGGQVTVVNNVIRYNKQVGLAILGALPKAIVLHNTFVANGFGGALGSGGAAVFLEFAGATTVQNNLITGNHGGLNALDGPNPGWHHNLVWGNATDYVHEAGPGAGDVSADPAFASTSAKDFRLLPGSPAVDAGVVVPGTPTTDFDGEARSVGGAPDLGAFELQTVAAAGALIINEVMANPLDESTGEFVELFNPTDVPIDAAGLVIDDGDDTDPIVAFDGGTTVVPAGGYAVVLDADADPAVVGVAAGAILLTVPTATIGSGLAVSDPILLRRNGSVVGTWSNPFNPGNGTSAERRDPAGPDAADNWVASPCGASPGAANCASLPSAAAVALAITEVMASPAVSSSGEFVEVYNHGTAPVSLVGLVFDDGDSSDVLIAADGYASQLAPGRYGLIVDPDLLALGALPYDLAAAGAVVTVDGSALGNGLAKDDPITLSTAAGTVLSTCSFPADLSAQSLERANALSEDVATSWAPSSCPAGHSAGSGTCSGSGPTPLVGLTITEVLANALDEDTGEFVELRNLGTEPLDLTGCYLTDGDSTDVLMPFPASDGSMVLQPGAWALVLDAEFADDFVIPAGTLLLRTDDTSIGNGLATNDPVRVLGPDGITVLSSFSFPFNPGNGISVERVGNAGDVDTNWVGSPCPSGSSPGRSNCSSPPEVPVVSPLVITEVMANPLVESTGEYVEITNRGTAPIALAGLILSDGDASDALVAVDGDGVVPAGGIAVVFDADYVEGTYVVPDTAIRLTTGDKALGSGLAMSDPITLLADDGTTVLSTYAHPFSTPDGVAVERVSVDAADEPGAWLPSVCAGGGSPGSATCVDEEPPVPGVTVVDVNTASSAQLEQVGGIGPQTAAKIIAWRSANGALEQLGELVQVDGINQADVDDWAVADADEAAVVLAVADVKPLLVFDTIGTMKNTLPVPTAAELPTWTPPRVRIQRVVMLDDDDSSTNAEVLLGDWGYDGAYYPEGDEQLPTRFEATDGQSYDRAQTRHADAMAEWSNADGDPYLGGTFYGWSSPLSGGGRLRYAHTYTVQGVMEWHEGDWRLRIRAREAAGSDGIVLIERWLPAQDWDELQIIWAYDYKSIVVTATNGYTYGLPYRLGLSHPARAWWKQTTGELLTMPRCTGWWECTADDGYSWPQVNVALDAWKQAGTPGAW